jgi:hypothetical protein
MIPAFGSFLGSEPCSQTFVSYHDHDDEKSNDPSSVDSFSAFSVRSEATSSYQSWTTLQRARSGPCGSEQDWVRCAQPFWWFEFLSFR